MGIEPVVARFVSVLMSLYLCLKRVFLMVYRFSRARGKLA